MNVSPTKAVKLYKVSKPTLYADMKSGRLSYQIDERKKRKINVAELDRLYEKRNTEQGANTTKTVKSAESFTNVNVQKSKLERELDETRLKLEQGQKREIDILKSQIEQQQEQIELLNKNLNKALDITALLEDKREGQGSKEIENEQKLKKLEEQISKLASTNQKLIHREKERRRKMEEQQVKKSRGLFNRIFS